MEFKNNLERLIIGFIIFLFFVTCFLNLDSRNFIWDETQNSVFGIFLLKILQLPSYSLTMLKDFAIDLQIHYPFIGNIFHHPPLQRLMVFLSFLFFGVSVAAARFPSTIFGAVGLYLVYLTGKEAHSKKVGLLSMVLLFLTPMYLEYSRLAMIDGILTTLILSSFYFFVKFVKNNKNWKYLSLSMGLSFLTKFSAILMIPPMFLYLLFLKKSLKPFMKVVFLSSLPSVIWLLFLFSLPHIGVPYLLLEKYKYFDFKFVGIRWLVFSHLKQFSYVIGSTSLLGLVYSLYKKHQILMVLWILSFYFFFSLFVLPSEGHLHRFTLPTVPLWIILSAIFIKDVISNKKLIILLLVVSSFLSINYQLNVNVKYPMENATLWILSNSKENCTLISDDKGLQFYFMKYDKNLHLRFWSICSLRELKKIVEENFNPYKHLGAKPFKVCFVVVKNIPSKTKDIFEINGRSIYNIDISPCKDCYAYLTKRKDFKLIKVFGDSAKIFIFKNLSIK